MKYDIIIIGGGAAGLMAMKDLVEKGYRVCLLEAAARAGGRIYTLPKNGFDQPVEAGAEFIHGQLPLTLQLLKEANITYTPVTGKMISAKKGKWQEEEELDDHWGLFMHQLMKQRTDESIGQFLNKHFSAPVYEGLCEAVRGFAEGFDLADLSKASVLAIKKEWSKENGIQYRIPGGYIELINYMIEKCSQLNGVIHYSAVVKKIEYNKELAVVHTADNRQFEAPKLIITVSAGVLKAGSIEFAPVLTTSYEQALQQLGFGAVAKILLQFKSNFWKQYADDIGFLISDEEIPTWWTQLPMETNLLTGWFGGPKAMKAHEKIGTLLQSSLTSLSSIFRLPVTFLEEELKHHEIICWDDDPFIKGGYSYPTLGSEHARQVLSVPILDTIFLAGEALSEGESQGTVEAALESGKTVAARVVKKFVPS
jgi:monoamine oxidase